MLSTLIWPLFSLPAVSRTLAAAAPTPSSVCSPSTTYACPSQDLGGFDVGTGFINSDDLLVCVYPANQDSDWLRDYYCEYNPTNGLLAHDHDKELCPAQAVKQMCTQSGKVQAYKNTRAGRKRAVPANMLTRIGLAAVKQRKNGQDY